MSKNLFLIILLSALFINLDAQNKISKPLSSQYELSSIIPIKSFINTPIIVDNKGKNYPPQAGYTFPIKISLVDGIIDSTFSGYIWRTSIEIKNSTSTNFYLSNVNLKGDQSLFLYSQEKKHIYEYTSGEYNNISTDFIDGDKIIVELNSKSEITKIPFQVREVGILFDHQRGFGDAGNCEVHVNCSEGNDWQFQKNGIARILVKEGNTTFWCSGSLINNTRNNGEPLFLTANHCGINSDSIDYAEWMFYFNFESDNCIQPLEEPDYNLLTGSTLLSNSKFGTGGGSDFKLLRLFENPSLLFNPYFNGWDRSTIASPNGVTIHHPEGDLKMISTYHEPLTSTKYDNDQVDPNGMYWRVVWAQTENGFGVTEGGSSGSPLFNEEGLIIGSLTGGLASCTYLEQPDFYGKLSYSWDPITSDSASQLAYWLDPIGSGVVYLNGTNLDSTNILAGFVSNLRTVLIGDNVSFTNTSIGNITSYNWFFEGGEPSYSELEFPGDIRYKQVGEFDVRLIVSSPEGSDTLIIPDYIRVVPNISPNPSDGLFRLAFGKEIPDSYSLRIFGLNGKEVSFKIKEEGTSYLMINMNYLEAGCYLIRFSSDEVNASYKAMVF